MNNHAPAPERKAKRLFACVARQGLFPLVVYTLLFCLLTYPLVLKFSTHFFTDASDGMMNVWSIWWNNKAVTELHQVPWQTTYLHFPHGTTLLAHTWNPFNGLIGIVFLRFLTLIQAFNFILVFSFAAGGLTAFLLAYRFSRSYWPSLLAGAIFTFSNYHFAHAEGHLNLVALEWIPLFVLSWFGLLAKPSIMSGLAAAMALFGVILCDYYYFFYCLLAALLIALWKTIKEKDAFFMFRRVRLFPFLAFSAGVLLTSAPLVVSLVLLSLRDPLTRGHDPRSYSLDLLAPIISGGHWRFAELTECYWSRLPGNIHESSVHIGLSLIIVLAYVWLKRRKIQEPSLGFWYGSLFFFAVLSLGPALHVWGKELSWLKLPYALLEIILPPLKMSGVPVRMMIMVTLSAGVIAAIGFKDMFASARRSRWLGMILLCLLVIEYLPKPMPATRPSVPGYVNFLRSLPGNGGVIDLAASMYDALYYQTVHQKPLAFGHLARIPLRVERTDQRISGLVNNGEYTLLFRAFHFRYLVTKESPPATSGQGYLRSIYADGALNVYELGAALPNAAAGLLPNQDRAAGEEGAGYRGGHQADERGRQERPEPEP